MTPSRLRPALTMLQRVARTIWLRRQAQSDVNRWRDVQNLSSSWHARTAKLAGWVPPRSRVLEFGAGTRVLPEFLPPGCTYLPSDLVDRGPGTFVCDLNAPSLPTFPAHDVAMFSGVLEYIHDLDRLIGRLAQAGTTIVASYAIADGQALLTRRGHGWVNDLSEHELLALFGHHGYAPDAREPWEAQVLWRFRQPLKRVNESQVHAESETAIAMPPFARVHEAVAPRVSMVVPAFNQERYVAAAIRSVLDQAQFKHEQFDRVSTTVARAVARRPACLLNRGALAIVARSAFPRLRHPNA